VNLTIHPLAVDVNPNPSQVVALLHEPSQILVLLADGLERLIVGYVDMCGVVAGQVVQVVQSLQIDMQHADIALHTCIEPMEYGFRVRRINDKYVVSPEVTLCLSPNFVTVMWEK
jgi:hypothetical protein